MYMCLYTYQFLAQERKVNENALLIWERHSHICDKNKTALSDPTKISIYIHQIISPFYHIQLGDNSNPLRNTYLLHPTISQLKPFRMQTERHTLASILIPSLLTQSTKTFWHCSHK